MTLSKPCITVRHVDILMPRSTALDNLVRAGRRQGDNVLRRAATLGTAVLLALASPGLAATAHAKPVNCDPEVETCPGEGTPHPPIIYNLQGVIQDEGYESDGGIGQGRRVKIRGYSRLANASNDRIDADNIYVQCFAHDAIFGHPPTSEADSEDGGALVDVHFDSPWVYGVANFRVITVNCTHTARKNGINYTATSTRQITVPA